MKRTTKYIEAADYNTIMTLDGATRLRMAEEAPAPARLARARANVAEVPTPMSKEARAGAILMAVFTTAVWLLLTYFHSH
jgi:hypothetical protein